MNTYAFIWDLDGTLLDSYQIIVTSLYEMLAEQNITIAKEEIHTHVITYSVSAFLQEIADNYSLPFSQLKARYSEISASKKLDIPAISHAHDILSYLKDKGISSYVFTHRGATTMAVLDHLSLTPYFTEILTSESGFPRKPAPDAIQYLIDKYNLEKANTFYVGDRSIDMECAKNADILGLLYLPDNSVGEATGAETHIIKDLMDITNYIS